MEIIVVISMISTSMAIMVFWHRGWWCPRGDARAAIVVDPFIGIPILLIIVDTPACLLGMLVMTMTNIWAQCHMASIGMVRVIVGGEGRYAPERRATRLRHRKVFSVQYVSDVV